VTRKREWVLSQEAFHAFLACLDPDRTRAGEKYEALRRKLITFFHNRDCPEAEDLADETIDRVTRRLGEVEVHDLPKFVLGVARRVASEKHRDPAPPRRAPLPAAVPEEGLAALDQCLERLAAEERALILEYYRYEMSRKVRFREAMAAALGITTAALRVRAYRIRQQLQKCVAERLKQNRGFLT